jgi:hydroxymethyl cephem carbamoyltransferase
MRELDSCSINRTLLSVLALNPGHDGAVALVRDASLEFSIEAEKNSFPRFSDAGPELLVEAMQRMGDIPDVIAIIGWFQDELRGDSEYFGTADHVILQKEVSLFHRPARLFKSTHERSHIFCSYGLSPLSRGVPVMF